MNAGRTVPRLPRPFPLSIGLLLGLLLADGWAQQPVGAVTGAQVQLKGAVQVQAGRLTITSGTEIDVPQGSADLSLQRGGTIRICSPARLTVIAGGNGALLISLQQGGINLRYASPVPDSVLTPDFRLDTVVPPGQFSSTSTSLALDAQGKLCVHNQGSALTLQSMAAGPPRNIIAGDRLLFQPADGSATTVVACSCDQPALAPLPKTRAWQEAVGPLFPQTASLKYPAKNRVAAAPSQSTPPEAAPPAAQPVHPHHRNFFARIFGWLFGQPRPSPASSQP